MRITHSSTKCLTGNDRVPIKSTHWKVLKILTLKQILQRVPIAFAQVKESNTSENLLNEIRQIAYSLYQPKEITKNVYNNILNSINVWHKNGYYILNSKNSKTSDPCKLLLNLTDKVDLRRKYKYISLSNLSIYYTKNQHILKIQKSFIRKINLKFQLQRGMKNLKY